MFLLAREEGVLRVCVSACRDTQKGRKKEKSTEKGGDEAKSKENACCILKPDSTDI